MDLFPGQATIWTYNDERGRFERVYSGPCFSGFGSKKTYRWAIQISPAITKRENIDRFYDVLKQVFGDKFKIVHKDENDFYYFEQQCQREYQELIFVGNILRVPHEAPWFIERLPEEFSDKTFWECWHKVYLSYGDEGYLHYAHYGMPDDPKRTGSLSDSYNRLITTPKIPYGYVWRTALGNQF